MPRRKRTTLQKLAIFERDKGLCHICGEKIDGTREAWELEHKIPYALTNDDTDENLSPAHVSCHRRKTRQDKADIAKSNRVRAKHNGAKASPKRPIAGSKASKWKRKVGGGMERRD